MANSNVDELTGGCGCKGDGDDVVMGFQGRYSRPIADEAEYPARQQPMDSEMIPVSKMRLDESRQSLAFCWLAGKETRPSAEDFINPPPHNT